MGYHVHDFRADYARQLIRRSFVGSRYGHPERRGHERERRPELGLLVCLFTGIVFWGGIAALVL